MLIINTQKDIERWILNLIYEAAYCIQSKYPELVKFKDFKTISRLSTNNNSMLCPHPQKLGCFSIGEMPLTTNLLVEEIHLTNFIEMVWIYQDYLYQTPVIVGLGLCSCERLIYRC